MNEKRGLTLFLTCFLIGGIFSLTLLTGCIAKSTARDAASAPASVTKISEPQVPTKIHVTSAVTVMLDAPYNLKLEDLFNFTLEKDYLYANFMKSIDIVGWAVVDVTDGSMCVSDRPDCQFSIFPKRYVIRFDTGGTSNSVFAYDWQMRQEVLVPTGDNPWNPDIDGGMIVWQQRIPNGWRVAGYNVETQQSYVVTESQGYISDVHISGDWVGYVKRENAQSAKADIYVYRLTTQSQVHVAEIIYYESAHWEPYALGTERIAWIKPNTDGVPEVHVMDLTPGQDKVVNTDTLECMATSVILVDDMAIWTCTGHRYGLDLVHELPFELPLFPPNVEIAGGLEDSLVSTTRLVWILPPAAKDRYSVPALQIPEALPLQMVTAALVRE